MNALERQALLFGGLGLVAVVVLYFIGRNAAKITAGAAGAVVNAAGGVVTGTVKTIGANVGIPDTNDNLCQQDLANGRYWSASFNCPASDFLKGITGTNKTDASVTPGGMLDNTTAASDARLGQPRIIAPVVVNGTLQSGADRDLIH